MSLRQNTHKKTPTGERLSYQSECHCAKTRCRVRRALLCLVTSQNVTAPKHQPKRSRAKLCLVTSQNVTAPKLVISVKQLVISLVTSQNVTAPKLSVCRSSCNPLLSYQSECHCAKTCDWVSCLPWGLVTSQNVTAPKPSVDLAPAC